LFLFGREGQEETETMEAERNRRADEESTTSGSIAEDILVIAVMGYKVLRMIVVLVVVDLLEIR